MFAKNYRPDDDWHTLPRAPLRSHADYLEFCRCLLDETGHQEWDDILCALGVFRTDHWTHYAASYAMLLPLPAHLALPAPVWLFLAATIIAYCQPLLQQALAARMSWKHELPASSPAVAIHFSRFSAGSYSATALEAEYRLLAQRLAVPLLQGGTLDALFSASLPYCPPSSSSFQASFPLCPCAPEPRCCFTALWPGLLPFP